MNVQQLKELLTRPEWAEVEIKKSARDFPADACSTICAFANCGGGYLILGVDETRLPHISGIDSDKFDDVQNQCLGLLKDIQKFSAPLVYEDPIKFQVENALVLVIPIQDSKRANKPVKLREKGHWQAYVRKGSRDEKASDEELNRMILDANSSGVTDQLLDLNIESCFSQSTLKWYRKVYESRHNQKHFQLSDVEFLDELGLIREVGDDLKPTKAAILMFGTEKNLNRILNRKVVDAIWYNRNLEDPSSHQRWADRRPEDDSPNLFDAWRILADRFMYWSEQPFEIDETNLQRSNETPDYLGFREAAVNLLVHQDFADHLRVPKIEFFKDGSRYWNPGDSLVSDKDLAKGESAARNPLIIQTFHRIGLSERAGSGLRDIYKKWQQLDRPEPQIVNDRTAKTFQITLGKKPHVSELQEQLQQRIGVKLNQTQAKVFASCILKPVFNETLIKALGLNAEDIAAALKYLTLQGLIFSSGDGYQASAHFQAPLANIALDTNESTLAVGDQASDQPHAKVTNLTEQELISDQPHIKSDQANNRALQDISAQLSKKQTLLLTQFQGEISLQQLMAVAGVTHRTYFKNKQLQTLISLGLVKETYPENSNHPLQAYVLSAKGEMMKTWLEGKQ